MKKYFTFMKRLDCEKYDVMQVNKSFTRLIAIVCTVDNAEIAEKIVQGLKNGVVEL